MKLSDCQFIHEKAKTKANGCYRIRGIAYRVRDGRVTHFAYRGEIIEPHGVFHVAIGRYDVPQYRASDEAGQKFLRTI